MQPPATKLAELPDRLVLVGASVRAAAQSARRGGFLVAGVDLFGDTDTLQACDQYSRLDHPQGPQALETLTGGSPVIVVGGVSAGLVPKNADILGANSETICQLRRPDVLRQAAQACGLQFPETLVDAREAPPNRQNVRWLKKKNSSSGGLGVSWERAGGGSADESNQRPGNRLPQPYIWQQWIPGRAIGATLFSDACGISLLGIFKSQFVRRGSNPFVYAGSFGPLSRSSNALEISPLLAQRLVRFGEMVSQKHHLRGLFNVDLIVDRHAAGWVLEINPRWTAASELVERSLSERGLLAPNDSLMRWHVIAQNQCLPIALPSVQAADHDSVWIKRVIYAPRDGVINPRCLDEIPNRNKVEIADLPPAQRTHGRGEPVLTIITKLSPHQRPTPKSLSPFELRDTIRAVRGHIQPLGRGDVDYSPRSSAYE